MLLSRDWKAGLTAFQTYQGPREVETTALPAFQQSIIIPSLPGSHHQVIPLLIKILQSLITQLIMAVFLSPGLAVQALGGPRVLFPGLAVRTLSSYIVTHSPSARSPPWASTLGQEGPTLLPWGPFQHPLHSPGKGASSPLPRDQTPRCSSWQHSRELLAPAHTSAHTLTLSAGAHAFSHPHLLCAPHARAPPCK